MIHTAIARHRHRQGRRHRDRHDHQLLPMLRWLSAATSRRSTLNMLDDLHVVLQRHFDREEAPGGLFDTLIEAVPSRQGVVELLRRDHRELVLDAATVSDFVHRSDGDDAACRDRIAQLVTAIHDHEAREVDLLADAFSQDIGVGD